MDGGAHIGEFYQNYRRYGYSGQIICIEPTPESFKRLQLNEKNDERFSLQNFALAEKSGSVNLNLFESSVMNSVLEVNENTSYNIGAPVTVLQVPSISLDDLIDQYAGIFLNIFLKLDVQGLEMQILSGLHRNINSIVGIQVELSINPIYLGASRLLEFVLWTEQNGFDIVSIATERFHRKHLSAYDVDVLALRNVSPH